MRRNRRFGVLAAILLIAPGRWPERPPPSRRSRRKGSDSPSARPDGRGTPLAVGQVCKMADRRTAGQAGHRWKTPYALQRVRRCRRCGLGSLYSPAAETLVDATGECPVRLAGRRRAEGGLGTVVDGRTGAELGQSGPTRRCRVQGTRPQAAGPHCHCPTVRQDAAKIHEEGPQIIQAGAANHASTSLKEGFKNHKAAFADGLIRFYAHALPEK